MCDNSIKLNYAHKNMWRIGCVSNMFNSPVIHVQGVHRGFSMKSISADRGGTF